MLENRTLRGDVGLVVVRNGHDIDLAHSRKLTDGATLEKRREVDAHQAHATTPKLGHVVELVEGQKLAHSTDAPLGGRDALDAEPTVCLGVTNLVETGDDAGDSVGLA